MDKTEKEPRPKNTRVRYSRVDENRTPKNTLVTVRDNGVVYFGISRCNRKLDVFHKNIGTYIANERAALARDEIKVSKYNVLKDTEIRLHESGLRGSVPFDNVKEVVKYFRSVDEYCLDKLAPRTVEV